MKTKERSGWRVFFYVIIGLLVVPLLATGIIDKIRRSSEGWEMHGKQGTIHFISIESRIAKDRPMLEQIAREVLRHGSQPNVGTVMFFDSKGSVPTQLPMSNQEMSSFRASFSSNPIAGDSFAWNSK